MPPWSLQTQSDQTVHMHKVVSTDPDEVRLYCYSEERAEKERGIVERFAARFETALTKLNDGLARPRAHKRLDQVWQRIGRLKAKHSRVASHYQVAVTANEAGDQAGAVTWTRRPQDGDGYPRALGPLTARRRRVAYYCSPTAERTGTSRLAASNRKHAASPWPTMIPYCAGPSSYRDMSSVAAVDVAEHAAGEFGDGDGHVTACSTGHRLEPHSRASLTWGSASDLVARLGERREAIDVRGVARAALTVRRHGRSKPSCSLPTH